MQNSDQSIRAIRARLSFAESESMDSTRRRKVQRKRARSLKYFQRVEFSESKC